MEEVAYQKTHGNRVTTTKNKWSPHMEQSYHTTAAVLRQKLAYSEGLFMTFLSKCYNNVL